MILDKVIGKSELEAIHLCVDDGYTLRVESIDGENFMVTQEFNTKRINVKIENGKITKSRIG